jgi:predicted transcriptional regulator
MKYTPSEKLQKLAAQIQETGQPIKITPKELIEHYGAKSRKTGVKYKIDQSLAELRLKTEPDYKSEYLLSEILLKVDEDELIQEDFVQRLKLLDAANTPPCTVSKNDSIEKAMTLMMVNDYSQLPVMNTPTAKQVDGMVSWHSIGWTTAKGVKIATVADCMNKDFTILKYDTPILEAVDTIKEKRVVLVQKVDRSISGLVTISDLADEFLSLSEPFLYLGQIENSLRVLLNDKFTVEELKEIKYAGDEREIDSVSDLSFTEYIELIRRGDNWSKIKLPLDCDQFTKNLEEVRDIRNDVMHFTTDRLDEEQEQVLRQTAQFLKEILTK